MINGAPFLLRSLYFFLLGTYKKIREVQGLLAPRYFASTENELFYELKGGYALPMTCGWYKAFSTNVKDIVLVRAADMAEENKIEKIRAQIRM